MKTSQRETSFRHRILQFWSPQTPLAEGLKGTIVYFEELLRNQSVPAQLMATGAGAPTNVR